MAKIIVDNVEVEVDGEDNVLSACLSHGLNLPYFCWHPALGSVGACRQCAVKTYRDENDTRGMIVMSCMTPVRDGMRLSIKDADATKFRAEVIEWLMQSHPHDCPVCDEGGECHLQDMTVMTGHNYRKTRFPKRTYRNQKLGPFINHEMNRCIQCYRCVRYYKDYAGGKDLGAFASKNHTYFGRHEDGTLESEFAGNLVEVCPTGVFTDKTLKQHYTRKWDLQMAPSVCQHCSVGCNISAGERYGTLRRVVNRYNSHVNKYFLCDRGRFGYEFVNSEARIRKPVLRAAADGVALSSRDDVLAAVAETLGDPSRVVGIGSPRASLEANFALKRLVGDERFSTGISAAESRAAASAIDVLRRSGAALASLGEIEKCDAAIVLGDDPTQFAPRFALALRQSVRVQPLAAARELDLPKWHDLALREAIQQDRGPLFVASPWPTRLDDVASGRFIGAPADIARFAHAVATRVASGTDTAGFDEATRDRITKIARDLKDADAPLVVASTGLLNESLIKAAGALAAALVAAGKPARIAIAFAECNTVGVSMLGGMDATAALGRVAAGEADTLVVLENDLYRRAPAELVDKALDKARVVLVDHTMTPTAARAGSILPAATFGEGDGTIVNHEGRAQRYFQVYPPAGDVSESWRWIRDLAVKAKRAEFEAWNDLDDITRDLAKAAGFEKIGDVAPNADFRVSGLKVARMTHRVSGRTAQNAHINIHEQKPLDDPDAPLVFSMEGHQGQVPGAIKPFFWAPGWNSIQSTHKYMAEVGGPLTGGDPGIDLLSVEPGGDFGSAPAPATANGALGILPRHFIYGSEELSNLAPAVRAQTPAASVLLSEDTAKAGGFADGDAVEFAVNGHAVPATLTVAPGVAPGVLGVPAGFAHFGYVEPASATLKKVTS
ncbi:NADH-quinone oxidoreductase subunit NuoG [bacterium]|nr:NADH-quinone oxidoreductase subunit NuoG [bacterium]